jgi:hypothetical protein
MTWCPARGPYRHECCQDAIKGTFGCLQCLCNNKIRGILGGQLVLLLKRLQRRPCYRRNHSEMGNTIIETDRFLMIRKLSLELTAGTSKRLSLRLTPPSGKDRYSSGVLCPLGSGNGRHPFSHNRFARLCLLGLSSDSRSRRAESRATRYPSKATRALKVFLHLGFTSKGQLQLQVTERVESLQKSIVPEVRR